MVHNGSGTGFAARLSALAAVARALLGMLEFVCFAFHGQVSVRGFVNFYKYLIGCPFRRQQGIWKSFWKQGPQDGGTLDTLFALSMLAKYQTRSVNVSGH